MICNNRLSVSLIIRTAFYLSEDNSYLIIDGFIGDALP